MLTSLPSKLRVFRTFQSLLTRYFSGVMRNKLRCVFHKCSRSIHSNQLNLCYRQFEHFVQIFLVYQQKFRFGNACFYLERDMYTKYYVLKNQERRQRVFKTRIFECIRARLVYNHVDWRKYFEECYLQKTGVQGVSEWWNLKILKTRIIRARQIKNFQKHKTDADPKGFFCLVFMKNCFSYTDGKIWYWGLSKYVWRAY